MKIVYLAAGAAEMYCGSCLHDNTLATALTAEGDEVLLTPTYTPIRTDEADISLDRVFFGGINVYLQQKSSLFRHTPWWLDRWIDSRWLLKLVTRRAPAVRAENLGDLTVSMLQGESGQQKKEIDKLLHWLAGEIRPELVHLSNAMLLGMAGPIRERLGVPVVCSLSGEDVFLEKLTQPYYNQARDLLRAQVRHADALVAYNRYYADFMIDYLGVPGSLVHVIPHGLRLTGHAQRPWPAESPHFVIGYFARVCHDKGLHLLVQAFIRLCQDSSLPPLRLRVGGYLGPADRPYLAEVERELAQAGVADRCEYVGEVSRDAKLEFLRSLDVMSVPTVYRESKGLSILEAWANGVPVVLPAHGTFPELVADTQGGLLCRPGDVDSLATQLARLARDRRLAAQLGQAGRQAIVDRYHDRHMAQEHRRLYSRLLEDHARRSPMAAQRTS